MGVKFDLIKLRWQYKPRTLSLSILNLELVNVEKLMTDKDGRELITQSEAAMLRGVTLASINELVRAGRLNHADIYGKRLVYRDEVLAFEPKTHKAKWTKKKSAGKGRGKKR